MPMTIDEVRLTKWETDVTKDGRSADIEFEVDFIGNYDGSTAADLTTITPLDLAEMDLTIGAEVGAPGSGMRVIRRTPRIDPSNFAFGGGVGTFSIIVRAEETDDDLTENPLMRKDVVTYRRDGQPVEIAYDRAGRIIATYRAATFEESAFPTNPDAVPIEIFAQLPTVPSGKITATISGYRDAYKLGIQEFITEVVNEPDFAKRKDWKIVNSAPVTIDGITWPAKSVCFTRGGASRARINGYSVIEHTWELEFAATHDLVVPNIGTYDFDASRELGKEIQRIWDPTTNTFRNCPWPLGVNGKALPSGYKASDVVYLTFSVTRPADFSYFGWRF